MTKTEAIADSAKDMPAQSSSGGWQAFGRHCLQAVLLCVLAFSSYLFASNFVLQSVRVVGSSMVPTLHDSDRYLLNRWIYRVRSPGRSEIVVLRDPADGGFSVKRVIAVEGDTLALKDAQVFLNGKPLKESYLPPGTATFSDIYKSELTLRVGPGQFFVLGDNRGNSVDSRSYGLVPRGNVLGMIVR